MRFASSNALLVNTIQEEFEDGPWNKLEAERKAQTIVKALRALDPAPEYVIILLSHDYTQANLLRPDILKGTDWVHQAVAQAFPVEMLTVVTRDHWTIPHSYEEDYNDMRGASKYSCYAFTKEDLAWLAGEGPKPAYEWEAAAAAGRTLLVAPTAAQKKKLEQRESGYSGNQYEEGAESLCVYFEAALVIKLTEKSDGQLSVEEPKGAEENSQRRSLISQGSQLTFPLAFS